MGTQRRHSWFEGLGVYLSRVRAMTCTPVGRRDAFDEPRRACTRAFRFTRTVSRGAADDVRDERQGASPRVPRAARRRARLPRVVAENILPASRASSKMRRAMPLVADHRAMDG